MTARPVCPLTFDERVERMRANHRSRIWRDDETGALLVGLNDFFVPAADAEEIPPTELADVLGRWETRGWWGILDWVIQRRYVRGRFDAEAVIRERVAALSDQDLLRMFVQGNYDNAKVVLLGALLA